MTAEQILILVAVGTVGGVLAGLLGIGGGVLMVPAMVLLLDYDQHLAQGTSLLAILPAAVMGTWVSHGADRFRVKDAVVLALGGIVGATIGGLTALSLDGVALRALFAVFLSASGVRMMLNGWRARGFDARSPNKNR